MILPFTIVEWLFLDSILLIVVVLIFVGSMVELLVSELT